MYSLSEGTESDNAKACVSGKLDETFDPTVCGIAEKSLSQPPVRCGEDSDCAGSLGGHTKCQCTWNGDSYCHLFEGDQEYVTMR